MVFSTIPGWYRGFSTKNRAVKGIFPSSYVHLKPCKIDNEGLFESVIPLEDPVVREVTLVLREWGSIWKRLYVVSTTCISYKFFPPRSPHSFLISEKPIYVFWLNGVLFVIKNAIDEETAILFYILIFSFISLLLHCEILTHLIFYKTRY